jgi:glycosyltransferase involved in cell wall biosynthesis
MIVRDGAEGLADCLASVAGVADELIVVDTGSSDDSVEIARGFAARVFRVPWPNDFAAARNIYLGLAGDSWVFSLDADERLETVDPDVFRTTLAENPRTAFAFTIRTAVNPRGLSESAAPSDLDATGPLGEPWVCSRTVRLFPNQAGITYRYPVHESLIPALLAHGIEIRPSHLVIRHRGHASPASAAAKLALYRDLGLRKIQQYPRYFLGHLEIGKVFIETGELARAERAVRCCIGLNPLFSAAYFYLALVWLKQGRIAQASVVVRNSPMPRLDRVYLRGLLCLAQGRVDQATIAFREVANAQPAFMPALGTRASFPELFGPTDLGE